MNIEHWKTKMLREDIICNINLQLIISKTNIIKWIIVVSTIIYPWILNLSIQGNEGKFHDAREGNYLYLVKNVLWIMEVTTLQTCIFQRQ